MENPKSLKLLAAKVGCEHHLSKFNELKKVHYLTPDGVCQHFGGCSKYYIAIEKSHFECTLKFDPGLIFAIACNYGKIEIVKFLISYGLYQPKFYHNCIVGASQFGHLELVKFLTTLEASNREIAHNNAIAAAKKNNHLKIVTYLKSFWPFYRRYPIQNIIPEIFACIIIFLLITVALLLYYSSPWWKLINKILIVISLAALLFILVIHLKFIKPKN